MKPDPETVKAIEAALKDAKSGALQSVVIAGITPNGHGQVFCNMSDDELANTLDWVAEAFSEPQGEILTYAIH